MQSLYKAYPELEFDRMFNSTETAVLSMMSAEKQRQYISNETVAFLEENTSGKHAKYDIEEAMLWALMYEIASYGFDLKSASYFAASFTNLPHINALRKELMAEGYPDMGNEAQLLQFDSRIESLEHRDPLLIHCYPKVGDPKTFLNTICGSGNVNISDALGVFSKDKRFCFTINFSEFQRRFLLRYESIR